MDEPNATITLARHCQRLSADVFAITAHAAEALFVVIDLSKACVIYGHHYGGSTKLFSRIDADFEVRAQS